MTPPERLHTGRNILFQWILDRLKGCEKDWTDSHYVTGLRICDDNDTPSGAMPTGIILNKLLLLGTGC